jgi:hypothetical protein
MPHWRYYYKAHYNDKYTYGKDYKMTDFILLKYWRILGLNNWRISPYTIHRFYASLAPSLARDTTTINIIMYRFVKIFVLHRLLIWVPW